MQTFEPATVSGKGHLLNLTSVKKSYAPSADMTYVIFPRFLSQDEIAMLHAAARDPTARRTDRTGDFEYHHVAHRIEETVKNTYGDLYQKLMTLIVSTDAEVWKQFQSYPTVYPRIEHIYYDGTPPGAKYAVTPHIDDYSVVTLVCLLSDSTEFVGGLNGFRGVTPGGDDRFERLEAGDVVLFRGEKLSHWVTPVTAGIRQTLAIEMSNKNCPYT